MNRYSTCCGLSACHRLDVKEGRLAPATITFRNIVHSWIHPTLEIWRDPVIWVSGFNLIFKKIFRTNKTGCWGCVCLLWCSGRFFGSESRQLSYSKFQITVACSGGVACYFQGLFGSDSRHTYPGQDLDEFRCCGETGDSEEKDTGGSERDFREPSRLQFFR